MLQPDKTITLRDFQIPQRKDRLDRTGGGVMILIRNKIPFTPINLATNLEAVACKVHMGSTSYTICSLYIPPGYSNQTLSSDMTDLVQQLPSPFIIAADSNAHHSSWGSNYNDCRGKSIDRWITASAFDLLNTGEPTYLCSNGSYTHIDLTITSNNLSPSLLWQPHSDSFNSDHFPIIIDSNIDSPTQPSPTRWNLTTANWSGYRTDLALPVSFLSPTQACGVLIDSIKTAAKKNVKQSRGGASHKYCKYWWTEACAVAVKNKKHAYNKYKRHLGNMDLWIDFKKARAIARKTILDAKAQSWQEFVKTITSRTLSSEIWRKVRALKGTPPRRRIILKDLINNNVITQEEELADIFALQYSRRSNNSYADATFTAHKRASEQYKISFPHSQEEQYNRDFTIRELQRAISTTTSKSPGPDNIPFEFYKQMSPEQQLKLLKFYNYIWDSGLPHQWRESTVIPLPKPGKCVTDPQSYRPIALTNCSCKIMEKMVNWRLQAYLEENSLLRSHQSGFRSYHTTTDALVRLEHSVRTSLIKKEYCIAVFLDIAQAFDTVWHHGLVQKILDLGLLGNLPCFLSDFLKMRKLAVRIGTTSSSQYPLHSGVPQGSVLSPTLFNIMINDIFDGCHPSIQTSLYADDGAMWLSHQNLEEGLDIVQGALEQVHRWSQMWGLQVSASKSKAIIFTNNRPANIQKLTFNGSDIDYSKKVKFLGVTLDRLLTWQPHINNIKERCTKDQRLLRIISANNWGADFVSLKRIYCALIRSKIEYVGFLFETAAPTHLKTLDKIQYAAARTMLGAMKCTPTNTLEAEADLLPLRYRRQSLLTTYAMRVLSIRDHPVRSLLQNYHHYKIYRTARLPPIAGRISESFDSLNLSPARIALLPLEQRCTTYDPPCFLSLATTKKGDLRDSQWCTLHKRLQESQYSDRTPVFCDGSVQGEKSGCGIWCSKFNLKARLPDNVSIFTAELTALMYAITYIQNLPGRFVIYTDSYSSISALRQLKISNNYIISRILQILATSDEKIIIEWVPSHVGIIGNEAADTLATKSISMPENKKPCIPLEDMKKSVKNKLSENWQTDWSRINTKLHHLKTILGPTVRTDLDRKLQVCLTRLRLGTCMLTHGHHITKAARPVCQTCQCNMTLQHVLVDCPVFVMERRPMMRECRTSNMPLTMCNILSKDYPAEIVIGFLDNTQLLKRI